MNNYPPVVKIGVFLAAAFFVCLTGCSEEEGRLTFWVGGAPQEVDYWEKLVAEFEASSGIEVELIRQPAATGQRKQGLVIALASQQPDPDLFLMDIIWITQFVRSGWLEPMNGYFQEGSLHPQSFFASVIEKVDRYQDQYFALPAFLDVGVLYYRKDLLRKHGFDDPPETWEELLRYSLRIQEAERLREPNFNGFIWQGAQYEGLVCTFLEFISTFGGGMSGEGRVDLNRRGNLPALRFMQDLIQRYRISPPNTYTEMQEEEVRRSFQRGNALFERNWLYAWNLHQQSGSAVRGRIGMAPLPHAPEAQSAATLGGWHFGISKYSDAKERAWRLAAFLLSRQIQTRLMTNLGWYSCRRDVYSDPMVQRNVANVERLQRIIQQAVSRPDLAYYDHVSVIIQRYVNQCLSGRMNARDALAAMEREIRQIERFYGEK